MNDNPDLENLVLLWMRHRKWKVDPLSTLLVEFRHKKVFGKIVCLFYGNKMIALHFYNNNRDSDAEKNIKDGAFHRDIINPNFFPELEAWLNKLKKNHRRR